MEYPPPSELEIAEVERAVGHTLPEALVSLYVAQGNGGFGPDEGLLGLSTGHVTDLGDSALGLCQTLSSPDPEDPGWSWPSDLLPILHIGCAIYYCVHLAAPGNPVVQFDPNGFGPGDDWRGAFTVVSPSLEGWLGGL
ncbi:SMI1/KNR4 family protein [Cognatilysobacter bugurensis]|uniref:Knr4/Smi1-like domain-containing protein n=1 Tax=Cognatilysobacter bugurensis TaxID=543356 RepID=A0A918SWZ7_9GAMM|nr:hypothetical protein GCM10007067_12450 [Lysobacter bugurensis]